MMCMSRRQALLAASSIAALQLVPGYTLRAQAEPFSLLAILWSVMKEMENGLSIFDRLSGSAARHREAVARKLDEIATSQVRIEESLANLGRVIPEAIRSEFRNDALRKLAAKTQTYLQYSADAASDRRTQRLGDMAVGLDETVNYVGTFGVEALPAYLCAMSFQTDMHLQIRSSPQVLASVTDSQKMILSRWLVNDLEPRLHDLQDKRSLGKFDTIEKKGLRNIKWGEFVNIRGDLFGGTVNVDNLFIRVELEHNGHYRITHEKSQKHFYSWTRKTSWPWAGVPAYYLASTVNSSFVYMDAVEEADRPIVFDQKVVQLVEHLRNGSYMVDGYQKPLSWLWTDKSPERALSPNTQAWPQLRQAYLNAAHEFFSRERQANGQLEAAQQETGSIVLMTRKALQVADTWKQRALMARG